jgi:GDPmannose 4,6-dehydratase
LDAVWGNPRKAQKKLNWHPRHGFLEVVEMMMEHDLNLAKQEKAMGHACQPAGTRMGTAAS